MTKRLRKLLMAVAALAALALGGAALAGAATTGATGSSGATGTTGATGQAVMPPAMGARFGGPAPGTAAHEDSEQAVTGAIATKARAAAVASLGGGTADAVTTNYDRTGYEVTVTKLDGTTAEVHMDLSFKVDTGHGPGGRGPNPGSQTSAPGSIA
jgi:hypothetical protein